MKSKTVSRLLLLLKKGNMECGLFQNDGQLERLAEMARYTTGKLAVLSGLSPRHFRRTFHERFGCSPREWLGHLKLIEAQDRLLDGEPVKRIAFELGYKNPSAFCHWFKCFSGLWPTEFLNSKMAKANQLAGPDLLGAHPG